MTVLDCACGLDPCVGSDVVHVDLTRQWLGRLVHADVVCDAHYLPFRNGAFDIVFSSHTLEHCSSPLLVLSEFRRVADRLVLRVPNASFHRGGVNEDCGHIYAWTSQSLGQLLKLVYSRVKVNGRIIRDWSRHSNIIVKQLVLVKTLLFVLLMWEPNDLEAICSSI